MARHFNGTSDRIDYPNVYNPSVAGGTPFTFAAWIYPDNVSLASDIFDIENVGGVGRVIIAMRGDLVSGSIRTIIRTTIDRRQNLAFPISTWSHLIVTYSGVFVSTNIHMYKDGVESGGSSLSDTGTQNTDEDGKWILGGRSVDTTRQWPGSMAEVGWWDRVITAGERDELAAGFAPILFLNGLRWYVPLLGQTNEPDQIAGVNGTFIGAGVTQIDGPAIRYAGTAGGVAGG
jgi:hypothetical protein